MAKRIERLEDEAARYETLMEKRQVRSRLLMVAHVAT
jgi:hypothetical protein